VLALTISGGTLNLMSLIGVIMLMGLVAKNAILLLDCAREEERRGIDREEALMHAGRVRLRPILMTTFALVAGMMPVAVGVGEGGEFYSPMAVAIIGGVMVSTLLTLLVVPSFYDSIEINTERAKLKFKARGLLYTPFGAFWLTLVEFVLTLTFMRFFYRCVMWCFDAYSPKEHPVEKAHRLHGFVIPDGFKPRPQPWQRKSGTPVLVYRTEGAAPPPPKREPPDLEPVGSN
jgi:hydrophobic/amphiphilic exporter-1 (mainly G- bacteria), HAE1 family